MQTVVFCSFVACSNNNLTKRQIQIASYSAKFHSEENALFLIKAMT